MEPSAEPTKQPSAWWRKPTGVLGLSLLAGGALASAPIALILIFGCPEEDPEEFIGLCLSLIVLFPLVGIPLTVAGALFALAAFVPVGVFWRALVGVGAAILAVLVILILIFVGVHTTIVAIATIAILTAAAAGFFALFRSYRVPR